MSFGGEHASYPCGKCAEICEACAGNEKNMHSMEWSIAKNVQGLVECVAEEYKKMVGATVLKKSENL